MNNCILLSIVVAVLQVCVIKCARLHDPDKDNSIQCLTCKKSVESAHAKWSNATSVAVILKEMDLQCAETSSNIIDFELCKKVAEIKVQIPPGIFEGLDNLAWPIPLGPCAFFRMCNVNCCDDNNIPEQIHISLAATDRSIMGVTWVTLTGDVSMVQYSTDKDSLSSVAVGTVDTYKESGWKGVIHRAKMTGLSEATRYYYRVGDGSIWSEIHSFKTFDSSKDVRFAVVADMAYDEWSDDTVSALNELVDKDEIDCIIHSGDISYADGFEPHFDAFFNKVQNIASSIPYMATPGNHEFWGNFTSYKHRFYMPGVVDEGGSGDSMFYSWEFGKIHFMALNSETAIDTPSFDKAEMEWVNEDLIDNVDRVRTPWLISHFHRPMYCSNDGDCDKDAAHLRDSAEEVFNQNKVDIAISGHVHSYERTYPMYQNQRVTDGYAPIYITQGSSGNREGNKGGGTYNTVPDWSAAQSVEYGYAILVVAADGSKLSWNFYNSSDRVVLDTLELVKIV